MNLDENKIKFNFSVCIIGAGISGLACADRLKENGFNNITILEASNTYGGRIRRFHKENNFADFDIELGGEEVHGMNTDYYNLVLKNGGNLFYYWDKNKFYTSYRNKLSDIEELTNVPEYNDLNFVWNMFEEISYNFKDEYPDATLREFLKINNINEDVYFLANAMIGVEAGTDLDHVSVKGYNNLCKAWTAGESNYFLTNTSHFVIITRAYQNVLSNIIYNHQVKKIEYTNSDADDEKIIIDDNLKFDFCIITIPTSQVHKIKFTPELPEKHRIAVSRLKLDNCAKIILKFKEAFWPSDSSWILIPGLVNVYWSTTQGKESKMNIITGMTSGENCRILNDLYKTDKNRFIEQILEEIEKGFLLTIGHLKNNLIDFIWFDWADEKFIEGGYTYPIINEGNIRFDLRESVDKNNRIFFAGEATAENGHHSTIHGAMESGIRAADQILNKFNNKQIFI
jgi:lysine-specific histone demethylase 1B